MTTKPRVRAALPRDVRAIRDLVAPYADRRILLAKEMVGYYEAVQEFVVAERDDQIVGCGALHVVWSDLAEVRTLAVLDGERGKGTGSRLLSELVDRARRLGLKRVFCLTFEVDFFEAHGFRRIDGPPVAAEVFAEMVRSHDDGVAELLDLAHVKQNTLGNTRMLLEL